MTPSSKAKVLLVEDDASIAFIVKDNLEDRGYEVVYCVDGETGWQQFMRNNFDICLLDVMLPKKDGLALAAQIRKKNETVPILMLTALGSDESKIAGFQKGIDDYITKPFNIQELLLRMEVFLKRTQKKSEPMEEPVPIGNLFFDFRNLQLKNEHETIQLTQREAELFRYFYQNKNTVLKREDILTKIWGKDDYFLGRSMDVFITKLRKYIKGQPGIEIQTIHGVGFKMIVS
ncbi:response regulator transcription factor [Rurimicrobium arvi]|uniref:Response regulator transcription factor n=1 Tax=Rurimicrobium arvi TaxID=2049916 RepID=A0ABP8MIY6_9BACT